MSSAPAPDDAPPVAPRPAGQSGASLATMARNSALFAMGEGIVKVLTAVLAPWFTMHLTPHEFGVWGLGAMVQSLLMPFFGLGLHGAVTRLYFDDERPEVRRRMQGSVTALQLVWGAGLAAVILLTAPLWQPRWLPSLPLWPLLALIIATALLAQTAALQLATWTASERAGAIVRWRAASSAVYLLAAIGLVTVFTIGVAGVFWARFAGALLLAVPIARWIWQQRLGWHGPTLRAALAFSLPLVPHLLAHWIMALSDRTMIDHMLGTAAVGIYTAAYAVPDAVNTLAISINGAYAPVINRHLDREPALVARAAGSFAAIVLSAGATASIVAPPLLRWVLDARYEGAAPLARVLGAGAALQGLYYVFVGALFARKQSRRVPLLTVLGGVVNIGLNLLWIPAYGVVGAAWATFVGYLVLAGGVAWAAHAGGGLPLEVGRMARIAAIGAGAAVVAALVDGALIDALPVGMARAALTLAAALAVAAGGGLGVFIALAPDDQAALTRRLAALRRRLPMA